jgi:hypothetical protein
VFPRIVRPGRGPSGPLRRPSGYVTNRSTCFAGTFDPARRPPRSHRIRPEYPSTTLDNLARLRTIRSLTSDRPGTELHMQRRHIWRTVRICTWTVRPGRGPSGPYARLLGMCKQNQEPHNMHSSRTHHSNTTVLHRQHILTMLCHLMYTRPNILWPPENPRDIE